MGCMLFCAFVASLVMAKPSQRQGESHDEVIETKLNQRQGKSHDEAIETKPNQRQGKSYDEVTKARLLLDCKVAKFHAKVAASDTKEPKEA